MRYLPVLSVLLLAACSDDSMTRNFSLSRDSAPQTVAATRCRCPRRRRWRCGQPPGRARAQQSDAQPAEQAAGSAGQDALVQAAGPAATADIRTVINENSGLVYPDPGFVDQLMNWTPPPGYTPVMTQAPGGGWFSRMF